MLEDVVEGDDVEALGLLESVGKVADPGRRHGVAGHGLVRFEADGVEAGDRRGTGEPAVGRTDVEQEHAGRTGALDPLQNLAAGPAPYVPQSPFARAFVDRARVLVDGDRQVRCPRRARVTSQAPRCQVGSASQGGAAHGARGHRLSIAPGRHFLAPRVEGRRVAGEVDGARGTACGRTHAAQSRRLGRHGDHDYCDPSGARGRGSVRIRAGAAPSPGQGDGQTEPGNHHFWGESPARRPLRPRSRSRACRARTRQLTR